jgi:hypothetical protein
MSQHDRILQWLEERGQQGVHSFEFYEARMPRGAAVIDVLKKEGHAITAERERFRGEANGVRYVLHPAETLFAVEATPTNVYFAEDAA